MYGRSICGSLYRRSLVVCNILSRNSFCFIFYVSVFLFITLIHSIMTCLPRQLLNALSAFVSGRSPAHPSRSTRFKNVGICFFRVEFGLCISLAQSQRVDTKETQTILITMKNNKRGGDRQRPRLHGRISVREHEMDEILCCRSFPSRWCGSADYRLSNSIR